MYKIASVLAEGLRAAGVSNGADPKKPNGGYTDTPKLPFGWCVHDIGRPQPEGVTPAEQIGQPPSDALILFDGTDLSNWVGTKQDNPKAEALWNVENGQSAERHPASRHQIGAPFAGIGFAARAPAKG